MPFVSRAGVRVHYDDVGDPARPTVLLHTGGCGDARMWEPAGYLTALASFRVLRLDHRGRGRSDRPREVAAHSLDDYVADVCAVLDDAAVARVGLVGYSDGARVAFGLASRHPARVAAVVAIDGLGPPSASEPWRAELADELRQKGTAAVISQLAAAEPQPPPRWLVDTLSATDSEVFAASLEAWAEAGSIWTELTAVTAPSLFLCGGHDWATVAADADLAASVLAQGSARIFSDLAHLQMFWRTDRTLPAIVDFLARQLAPL